MFGERIIHENYRVERYNCHPRKDDMIPFPFKKKRFHFFVADHLLVGQLCTNPKSDRNLLTCLKGTQCSTSEIGDAPLYNSCSLLILVMTKEPLPAPSKCKSGLPRIIGTCPGWWKKKFPARVMAEPSCGSRTRCQPTSPKRPRLGFRKNATTLYPSLTALLLPRPETPRLLRLVIRGEHHQHGLPQHQSKLDRHHPPSIRRAPASACGKGILPVPDPYRSSDWGWRRLHWIDVSSTT